MAAILKQVSAWFGALSIAVCIATPAAAEFDPQQALAISQSAIGRNIGDFQLRDAGFRPVNLSEFRGKPLLINLVYTSCSYDCPVVLETLAAAMDVAKAAVGEDRFRIVTVGFDSRVDTPQRMRAFAESHGIRDPNWHFLSAEPAVIDRLAETVGFVFYPSAKGFDHLALTTVVDADGTIYRQVYGSNFDPPFLVEPLKDLVFDRRRDPLSLDGLIDRVRWFCTVYDPTTGRYTFDYSPFIAIAVGGFSLIAMGVVILRGWRRQATG